MQEPRADGIRVFAEKQAEAIADVGGM